MLFSLDQSLGFVVNRTANQLKNALESNFAERGHNVSAEQWLVLSRLCEQDGVAQHEIAGRLSKDKTNMARILALMEKHQWIERHISPDDARVRLIYVTEHGRALHAELVSAAQGVLARAQTDLNAVEVQALIAALNLIYNNLG